jgi:hypothetical protein
MQARGVALAMTLLALGASGAPAAEQQLLGRALAVADPLPGVNPSRRKVVVSGREAPTDVTIVGDPLANGATIRVFANGGTSTSQTFVLPGGAYTSSPPTPGWKADIRPTRTTYKYLDKLGQASPVVAFSIRVQGSRRAMLKAVVDGQGNNPTITVVPPNPGSDGGMVFTINGGDSYCVTLGGAAGGKLGNKGDVAFKISRATAEAPCPAP